MKLLITLIAWAIAWTAMSTSLSIAVAQRRQPLKEPWACLEIEQSEQIVRFRLFSEGGGGKIRPTPITGIAIRRSQDRRTLWSVRDRRAYWDVFEIVYGVVPPNFRQVVPVDGSAPLLEEGVRYQVFADGPFADAEFIFRRPLARPPCQLGPQPD